MESFDALVSEFSRRPRRDEDGVPVESLREAEARLGLRLPEELRTMLLRIGEWDLLHAHNALRSPADLEECDGRIVFMDENQDVASWAVGRDAGEDEVWQRNNDDDEWHSEEVDLLEFLRSTLEWYREQGVFTFE